MQIDNLLQDEPLDVEAQLLRRISGENPSTTAGRDCYWKWCGISGVWAAPRAFGHIVGNELWLLPANSANRALVKVSVDWQDYGASGRGASHALQTPIQPGQGRALYRRKGREPGGRGTSRVGSVRMERVNRFVRQPRVLTRDEKKGHYSYFISDVPLPSQEHGLHIRSRLLTVNCYPRDGALAEQQRAPTKGPARFRLSHLSDLALDRRCDR